MRQFARVRAAGLAAALLLLAGCSGGRSTSNGADRAAAPMKSPAGERAEARATPARSLPPVASRAVVYTADLRVQNKDVAGAANRAKQIVLAAGGYVGSEDSSAGSDSTPSSTIIFKIPSATYTNVLGQLGSTLGRRLALRQQAGDVAQEVADIDSRVRSAKATLTTFRGLLNKAGTLSEIIRIENEISERQADLEALQARQKSLAQQTAYATVTLRLNGAPPPREKRSGGFTGGVSAGWHAFTVFLRGLASVVGWLLPFLGLAALIGLPAWYLRRRRRRAATS